MNKESLRIKYGQLRNELSEETLSTGSASIANQLRALPIWGATYFSVFLSITQKKEIDTDYILPILHSQDKEICVPKVAPNNELQHFLLTDNSLLKANKWGIPEPQNGLEVPPNMIEVVFVPLLAFDKAGHRVGYGKGFYDRFLSKCNPNTIKVGLSLFEATELLIPAETSDIPLTYCVSPTKIYRF